LAVNERPGADDSKRVATQDCCSLGRYSSSPIANRTIHRQLFIRGLHGIGHRITELGAEFKVQRILRLGISNHRLRFDFHQHLRRNQRAYLHQLTSPGESRGKNSPWALPIFSQSAMLITNILVRTTSFNVAPALCNADSMFLRSLYGLGIRIANANDLAIGRRWPWSRRHAR